MNCMKTFPTSVLVSMILAAASHSTYAFSAEHGGVAVTVRYDDLNLSAMSGVDTLNRRVSRAAAQVCVGAYGSDPLGRLRQNRCIRRATDNALAQVKWPEK